MFVTTRQVLLIIQTIVTLTDFNPKWNSIGRESYSIGSAWNIISFFLVKVDQPMSTEVNQFSHMEKKSIDDHYKMWHDPRTIK